MCHIYVCFMYFNSIIWQLGCRVVEHCAPWECWLWWWCLCGEDSDTFLLSGHDTLVGDLIDGADLLQELRTLNNVQKVSAKEAYSKHSDDQLFPNFTTRQLSWKESVILLLGIVTRHQRTGVALEDILSFLRLVCRKENKVPKDAKEVFSFFQNHSQKIVKHFYCPNKKCQSYVSHTTLHGRKSCGFCKGNLSEEALFLEIPIQEQLKTILSSKKHIHWPKKIPHTVLKPPKLKRSTKSLFSQ